MAQKQQWQSGFCCCCCDSGQGCNQCMFLCGGAFCPCIAQAILQVHSGLAKSCCGPCCFYCCLSGCTGNIGPCVALFNLRRTVAKASNIDEDCCCTLCKVLCCFCCTMSQVNNQFIVGNTKFKVEAEDCDCKFLMGCVYPQNGQAVELASIDSTVKGAPVTPNSMISP
jgi:hypothetical protein